MADDTSTAETPEGTIRFQCKCGKSYSTPAMNAGKVIACKGCGERIKIPGPQAREAKAETAKQEVRDSDDSRPQKTESPTPPSATNVKLHAITYVCVGITVLAVIVAVSAWRDAKELRNQLWQRDDLTASSQGPAKSASIAEAPELKGNDLLAWKLAYGSAIGDFCSEAFPSRPIRRLMTKNDNGTYVFLFSNLNETTHTPGFNPVSFYPHTMWEVTVMDYGDKLQVVSSHMKTLAPNQTMDELKKLFDELFGQYIRTAPLPGTANVPVKTVPKP
ncbi:MAG: hypothetical protein ABSA67_11355 [Candidatus Brocadiia bacterium]|jgi:hypothetical protein